jgi:hypothetical protein
MKSFVQVSARAGRLRLSKGSPRATSSSDESTLIVSKSAQLLPLEIIQIIIQQIEPEHERNGCLLKCALVCRDWLAWSRWLAFQDGTYILCCKRDPFLAPTSTIAPFVNHLIITQDRKMWYKGNSGVPEFLSSIIRRLNAGSFRIDSLTFRYIQFQILSAKDWEELRKLLRPITFVCISYCDFTCPAEVLEIICTPNQLTHLKLLCLSFAKRYPRHFWPDGSTQSEPVKSEAASRFSMIKNVVHRYNSMSPLHPKEREVCTYKPPTSLVEVALKVKRYWHERDLITTVLNMKDVLPWLFSAPALHRVSILGLHSPDVELLSEHLWSIKERLSYLHVSIYYSAGVSSL